MQKRISQTNAPPFEGEAGTRDSTRVKINSGLSLLDHPEDVYPESKFPLYRIVGTLNGDAIYLPESPSLRGPAIERMLRTTSYLGELTTEELEAWFCQRLRAQAFLEHLR